MKRRSQDHKAVETHDQTVALCRRASEQESERERAEWGMGSSTPLMARGWHGMSTCSRQTGRRANDEARGCA